MSVGKDKDMPKDIDFLGELPTEMVFELLSKLDISELTEFATISKKYNEIISSNYFWQNKIKEYFPYLLETNAEEISTKAKELFKKEYFKFLATVEFHNAITPREWRDALSGNLSGILKMDYKEPSHEVSPFSPWITSKKEMLLFFAACNGHERAISELKARYAETGYETIGRSPYDSSKGILTILNTLILRGAPELLKKIVEIGKYPPAAIKDALKQLAKLEDIASKYAEVPFDPISHSKSLTVYLELFKKYLTDDDFKHEDKDIQNILNKYKEIYQNLNKQSRHSFSKK